MKIIYNKPDLEVESFITEEIMENFNPENVLSRDTINLEGGYEYSTGNFVNFHRDDANVLNKIDYNDFIQ